jgi:hypothetical protein
MHPFIRPYSIQPIIFWDRGAGQTKQNTKENKSTYCQKQFVVS